MKILDRYILITFLKTFFNVFIIFMFIFILQGIWLYISELAGKDLDISVTAKFILYYIPKLIPLVVPLTILLSSIMVFGNFAENYEFAAMKSTGISLQRAMRSLSAFIIALGIGCFFFANNVIPWGEFEFYNLRRNIAKVKPALAIAEDQFTDIGNINIKVDKKSGKNGKDLEGIIIHKKSTSKTGNYKVIVSKRGELISSDDSNVLQLKLIDGNYYEEIVNKDALKNKNKPHAKSYFDSYTINVDLETLNSEDLEDKNFTGRYNMLNIQGLKYTIDSLNLKKQEAYKTLSKTLYNRTTYSALNLNVDTTKKDTLYKGKILDLFNLRNKIQILNIASNSAKTAKQVLESNKKNFETKQIWLNKHIIALHDKYVLAIACIILFFVGAPLGALIRKGGVGLPMVIAIALFLTYHFLGIFAKNSAEKGSFSPIIGSWFSTVIMLPLSIYLTSRATNDKGAVDIDNIFKPLKKWFGISKKTTINKPKLDENSEEFLVLTKFENLKLKQIVKNYRNFDYTIAHKNSAVSILNTRNITEQELKLTGYLSSQNQNETIRLKNEYKEYLNLAFILYGISAVLIILGGVFNNNKLPTLGISIFIIGIIIFIIYLLALAKLFSKHIDLYKHLGRYKSFNAVLFLLLGLPLYFIFYFIEKQQINLELFKTNKVNTQTTDNIKPLSANSKLLLKDYKDYSKTSLVSYSIALILLLSSFLFKNNKLLETAEICFNLSIIAFIFFSIYFVVDTVFYYKFHNSIQKRIKSNRFIFMILTLPIYPFRFIALNKGLNSVIYKSDDDDKIEKLQKL